MFDWIDYISLAKVLIEMNDEASLRSAISRLYYGFFGIVRRYLINVKNKYYLREHSYYVHSKVYDELFKSDEDIEIEIANILNKLRSLRNNADYDDGKNFDVNFFKTFFRKL